MSIPIKIFCASLNFKRLDTKALSDLSCAHLKNDMEGLSDFIYHLGFSIDGLSIINKCNAVIIVFCYNDNLSHDFVKSRVIDTWDRLSYGGIVESVKHIKFFDDIDAVKYLGECSVGLHSVVLGDSQVASQVCDSLQNVYNLKSENPTFRVISNWIRNLVNEVRLRTELFSGNLSMERIATEIVASNIEKDQFISVIGFGRSGKLVAKILNEELGYNLKIANRTSSVLSEVEKNNKIKIVNLNDYTELFSSECIIFTINLNEETREYFAKCVEYIKNEKKHPKLVIDLSGSSLVGRIDNVFSIEDIANKSSENLNKRTFEVNKVKDIINKNIAVVLENLNKEVGSFILKRQESEVIYKLDNEKLNLFKIRNDAYKIIRAQLDTSNFVEINTPCIVGVSTDPSKVDKGQAIGVSWQGGSNAFLRQSNQLYKQMVVASGMSKIYEMGPFWRAETSQSYRHLQESIGLDIELSNPRDLSELYELAYSIILNVKLKIWDIYGINTNNFILPKFDLVPVLTYSEAIVLLNSKGHPIGFGEDLGLTGEAKLGEIIKKERNSDVFIVKNYPDSIKKFYTKKIKNAETETFDIVVSGWELVSGAIRENDRSVIEKSMNLSKINPKDYNFYLSIIDGSVPHGGFCIGVDRLVAKILELETVSQAVVFPRTFNNLIP